MHDLHESVPFLYTFSGQAPQNPISIRSSTARCRGSRISRWRSSPSTACRACGLTAIVDEWSPGYVAFMSSNHNGLFRMYETFGNGGATTELRHVKPVDGPGEDHHPSDQTKREWFRPNPPYKTVEWSMRDNTNYMETGVLPALQMTSMFPQRSWRISTRRARIPSTPAGPRRPTPIVIPGDQPDMTRVAW